ncbi:MAG: 50S ribosomal protein L18 [Candidatus Hadarchaeales archaeon]
MKHGPRFRVQFRRKREGKTDYRLRLKLLKSGKPRLVVRPSSKHSSAQVVRASSIGDVVVASAHSKQLQKYGWKGGTANIPAAYLVGLLCGKRAAKAKVGECVLDMGFHVPVKGGKIFSLVKGAIDGGIAVNCSEDVFPDEGRIRGEHIAAFARHLKETSPELYRKRFSGYLAAGLPPEELPDHFNSVRQKILGAEV